MKVELTDIIQVTTADRQSKLVSIADILELVPKPVEATLETVKEIPKKATPKKPTPAKLEKTSPKKPTPAKDKDK